MKNQSKFAQFRNELEVLNKEEMKIVSGGYGQFSMGYSGGGGGGGGGGSMMGGTAAWGMGGVGNLKPTSLITSGPATPTVNWNNVADATNAGILSGIAGGLAVGSVSGPGSIGSALLGGVGGGVAGLISGIYNEINY